MPERDYSAYAWPNRTALALAIATVLDTPPLAYRHFCALAAFDRRNFEAGCA